METLLRVAKMLEERDSSFEFEDYPNLEETEFDLGLFPAGGDFGIPALATLETLDAEASVPFDSSAYLQHLMVGESNCLVSSVFSDPAYSKKALHLMT